MASPCYGHLPLLALRAEGEAGRYFAIMVPCRYEPPLPDP